MKKNYLLLVFFISVLGYSQTVDSNGAKTVKIVNPPIIQPISLALDRVHVSANGRNDGKIFINNPSGGTPFITGDPYKISWKNVNNADEVVDPENLFAGTYRVTVTDSKGCSVNEIYEITQPPLLAPGYTGITTDLCFGSETELTATVEGGFLTTNGVYKYSWAITYLDNSTESKTGKIVKGKAGKYELTVTDNAVPINSKSITINVTQSTAIAVATQATDVTCFGGNNGKITFQINNGKPFTTGDPYKIILTDDKNPANTITNLNQLKAGDYYYTITDANGCKFAPNPTLIHIGQPPSAVSVNPVIVQTQPSTSLASDGTIKVSGMGGTPKNDGTYTYTWFKGTTSINPDPDNDGKAVGLNNGTYYVIITDKNGCTATSDSMVLDALDIKIESYTDIKCYNDATGTITAKATGGKGSGYTYQWYKINGGTETPLTFTTPEISLVQSGTYRIRVWDGINQPVYVDQFLDQPTAALKATYSSTNVSCYGGNNGTVTLSIADGTIGNGYTYLWSNGSSTKNQNNLTVGTYSVTVKDANSCSVTISNIVITEPTSAVIIPAATITHVAIYGESTGAITLGNITGGNGGYVYKWSSSTYPGFTSIAKDISGIKAGSYTLLVTDSKLCTATQTFIVTQNPLLTVTLTESLSIQCNGDTNGKITSNVQGGVTNYSYKWYKNNIEIIGETQSFIENLGAGKYKLIVRDNVGAITESSELDLIQPDKLIVSLANKVNVLCYGNQTGTIDITVVGGTLPYTFIWKKDAEQTVYATTEDLINNLRSGTYSVVIKDKNNCETTLSNIIITQPAASLAITDIEVKNLSGFETKNGSIEVSISGGTVNYTYAWRVKGSPTIIGNTKLLDQLAIGTYELTVTDANNCTIIKDYTLIQPNKLLITAINETESIKCFGYKQGVLKATITGGAPIGVPDSSKNYIYRWYNELNPSVTVSTNNPTEALLAGNYFLEVSDGFGNSFTSNRVTINEPTPVKISFTQTNVSCKNGNDGQIQITTAGGTGAHTITWSVPSGANPNVIDKLYAGNYSVTVRDENNCFDTKDFVITEPEILAIKSVVKTPPSALGVDDASIAVTVQGGTPNYNFNWLDKDKNVIFTDNNQSSNTSIYNIYAGQYFISITDANGCQINLVQINSVQCFGNASASIKALTSGGLPGYYYKWYNVNDPTVVVGTAETLTNAKAGTYYVIATDSFDKSIQSQNITISEPTALANTLSSEYLRCGDLNDWTITSAVSGGTLPYTYLWNTGAKTPNLIDVVPGNYSLIVTDKNGCNITKNITITAPAHLDASENIKIPTCYAGSDASIVVTTIAGIAPFTYLWNTGETSNMLSNAKAGTYSIEIKDSKGCIISRTYTIENPPQDIINLGEDVTLCFDQTLTINATINDNQATYSWTSDKGFKSTDAMITVSQPAIYTVIVTNKLGCEATDSIQISSQNTAISAEFAVSSQAFLNEKIIVVDISNPIPDEVEWILPASAIVASKDKDYAEISFNQIGEHDITLITKKGNCVATQTKTIIVTEGEYENPDDTNLQKKFDLTIFPNPSDGHFTVDVTLDKIMPAHIKVYNLSNNQVIDSKYEEGKDKYSFNFSLNGLPSGIYFVLFESQQGNKLRKIIIK
jgi:hypothetical protein